jgi:hypothetical protein
MPKGKTIKVRRLAVKGTGKVTAVTQADILKARKNHDMFTVFYLPKKQSLVIIGLQKTIVLGIDERTMPPYGIELLAGIIDDGLRAIQEQVIAEIKGVEEKPKKVAKKKTKK